MKKKAFLFVLFAMIGVAAHSAEAAPAESGKIFQEANAFYETGKFKEAVAAYGSIAAEKRGGAAVFYNLANAELRSGHKGKARLWYERALKIDPRDPDVLWNLQVLKNALPDRIEPPSDPLAVAPLLKLLTERYTVDEAVLAVSGLLACLAVLSFLMWKFPTIRKWTGVFRGLLLMLLILSVFLFIVKWNEVKDPSVVVLTKEVTARYGPTTKETKAFLLHEGARARVLDQTKDWYYVRLDDGNEGWLSKDTCEIL